MTMELMAAEGTKSCPGEEIFPSALERFLNPQQMCLACFEIQGP
jgi:hypothetical protein